MSTYAFRAGGGACTTDSLTGEHQHHYPDVVLFAPEFAQPRPVHTLSPESVAAVEAHRRVAVADAVETFITDHGRPRVEPYIGPVPRNALALQRLAERHGFETLVVELVDGCRVEGYHTGRRVGFRATFARGKAAGASWHEPWRYGIVRDDRPVGVNALTRTGLKGKRAAGVGTTRLAILGNPNGIPCTHTELNGRIPE